MNQPSRIQWIDMSKGFAIILVVLGHVITNGISSDIINNESIIMLNGFVYKFHMPFFFFISGYLVKDFYCYEDKFYTQYILKRELNLVIPFTFFSLLYGFSKIVFSTSPAVNTAITTKDLLLFFINPIGEYWF